MLTVKATIIIISLLNTISLDTPNTAAKNYACYNEVTGHFTRKDKVETVWLVAPQINAGETGCVVNNNATGRGDCVAHLNFSDPNIPSIPVKGCIGGKPDNLGDLDGDGLDEIGLLPEWFTSCWRQYYVFTYKAGSWVLAVPPFATHCNQWEEDLQPIIRDPAIKGNVIITFSAFEGGNIVFKTRSIPIK